MSASREHHGIIYGVLSAFCAALSALFVKYVSTVPTSSFVFFRFFIGLLILLPWAFRSKFTLPLTRWKDHLMRNLGGLLSIFCLFYTIQHLSLVTAQTLANTSPLFVPLVVWFVMKSTVPKKRLFALAIGFIGVLFILRPTDLFSSLTTLVGVIGGCATAIAVVFVRKLSHVESAQTILISYFLSATILSSIPMLIFWKPIAPLAWLYLVAMSVISLLFQYCLTKSYTHLPASKASILSYLTILFGGLFGYLFWNEIPDMWAGIGIALILCGGTLSLLDRSA